MFTLINSQRDNLKVFKNELLETNRELIRENATLFFRLLDKGLQENASISTQDILEIIRNIDSSYSRNTIVMDIQQRYLFKGHDRPEMASLLDKDTIDPYLHEMLLTRNKDFYLDNYREYLIDKKGLIIPTGIYFRIYDSYGLIVGYGRTIETGKVRIEFAKKRNAEYFKLYFLISLIIYSVTMLLAIFISVRFMRRFFIIPLSQIGNGVNRVAKGKLDVRINVSFKDEIGQLASAFNAMTENLQNTTVSRDELVKEVAERKKAEENSRIAEEQYRAQFEGAMDAIFVADAETGILIDCNPAAAKLVEREKSELIGQHQRILHPPEEIEGEFSRTFQQHLKEKQGQALEARVITKSGEMRDVWIKANLFEVRGREVMQGIFRDITDRKKADEQQKLLLKDLEDMNKIMVGRELKMIELKNQVNILSKELGRPEPYK